jgi:oxygen-independent coproporphyrinogen-3 oxidase
LCTLSDGFEPSVEATFSTLNQPKIKKVVQSGIKRISLGIQSANDSFMRENHRENGTLNKMLRIFDMCRNEGVEKLNIDMMYGFRNQEEKELEKTLQTIEILNPEQITIYELRTNMISHQSKNSEGLFEQYDFLYNNIVTMGYNSTYGQNTFSKFNDSGVSSYLRHRMHDNMSYKGFGISAQSKSNRGVSYNIGKGGQLLDDCLSKSTFYEQDVYLLPAEELLAKYMAISGYAGSFNSDIMSKILDRDVFDYFKNEFNYLFEKKYIDRRRNILQITPKGFIHYGIILSLFYPENCLL